MPSDTSKDEDQVRQIISRLQAPISDLSLLLALLCSPLDCLALLPSQFRRYNLDPLPKNSVKIRKHISAIQHALLIHIAPTWDCILKENNATQLIQKYFCPESPPYASHTAEEIARISYSTLMTIPLDEYSMRLLERLNLEYPIDRLYLGIYARNDIDASIRDITWEDCVRNILMVPTKVANATGGTSEMFPSLEYGVFLNTICIRCEMLIQQMAMKSSKDTKIPITFILTKLVNLGVYPASPPVQRSQPSFFHSTLPTIRTRLKSDNAKAYTAYWSMIMLNIPSSLTLKSVLTSLFSSLKTVQPPSGDSPSVRAHVKQESLLLSGLVGTISPGMQDLWEVATSLVIGGDFEESHARIFVCWLSGGSLTGEVNIEALDSFLESVLETWSSPVNIKHSLLSRHRYVTSLLILTVSYLPPTLEQVKALAFSTAFIQGVGTYISHVDSSVRRCGMLAAEVVAHLVGKRLDFGDWTGEDSGKPWARELRQLLKAKDIDTNLEILGATTTEDEIPNTVSKDIDDNIKSRANFSSRVDDYDSDDSITGYASVPSSRSVSPTPSELAEIEKDPTLNVGVKKVNRPVYLAQLGDLLRGGGPKSGADDPHEADKIEMALNCAEELIRRKRDYGTELEENAVVLVYGLLGLQDNFDLDEFDTKRQGALNALIDCAPRKAAPALIEEFFKNQYSTNQRYAALNALALGARGLASLPIPPSRVPIERTLFPSKTLPTSLHHKYLQNRADTELIPQIAYDISKQAIDKQKEPSVDKVPELVRERRLRIRKAPNISEVTPSGALQEISKTKKTTFTSVAAEFFIMPLVNRFWSFLRDEQTREERTAHREGRNRYFGAGTGLILNPIVLSHFLQTLAILVNASQNALEWLSIIAPETLELALTLGTRPISQMENSDDDLSVDGGLGGKEKKQAAVLTSALEVALVVLDGSLEIDGGRVLGLEHTALLLGVGEWASKIFTSLDSGVLLEGGGGTHEVKLRRTVAGLLLKVDDLTSRWRRSMLDNI